MQLLYKCVNVTSVSLKVNDKMVAGKKLFFNGLPWNRIHMDLHSCSKLDPDPHEIDADPKN
jgi:hypothetical protein